MTWIADILKLWSRKEARILADYEAAAAELALLRPRVWTPPTPLRLHYETGRDALYATITEQLQCWQVQLWDNRYNIPFKSVWEHLWQNYQPQLPYQRDRLDCEDYTIFAMAQGRWHGLPIGMLEVETSTGEPHACNVILYREAGLNKVGCLDYTPRAVFSNPPPEGVFSPSFWKTIKGAKV